MGRMQKAEAPTGQEWPLDLGGVKEDSIAWLRGIVIGECSGLEEISHIVSERESMQLVSDHSPDSRRRD